MIIKEERESLREIGKGILFCLIGIVLVAGITWANGNLGGAEPRKLSLDCRGHRSGLGFGNAVYKRKKCRKWELKSEFWT